MRVRVYYKQTTTHTWYVDADVRPEAKLEQVPHDLVGDVSDDAKLEEETVWTKIEILPDPTELCL